MPAVWLTAPPACAASFSSNSRGESPFLHGHAGRSFFRLFPSPAAPPGRSPRSMPFAPITTVPSQVSLSRSRQSPANALFSLPAYHAPALLSPAFRHPGKFSASKLLPLAAPSTSHRPLPAVRSFRCLLAAVRLPCRPMHPPLCFPPPTASSILLPAAYPTRFAPRPPIPHPVHSLPKAARCAQPPKAPRLPALCPAMPFISAPFLPSPFSLVFSRGKEHSPARAPC